MTTAQSAEVELAVEYTDCYSAEGWDRPKWMSCYDTKQSDGEAWGMQNTPSLPSLPCSLWPGVVVPDKVLSMVQIKLNCILMLNWITWNGTVFSHWNCVLVLNWIVWNKSFWHWTWIIWNRTVLTFNCVQTKNYIHAKLNCLK